MYTPPTNLPTDPQALVRALVDELRRVSQGIQAPGSITLSPQRAAPSKPRDGDMVFVDGTAWVPAGGNGAGFYGFRAGAWRFLG